MAQGDTSFTDATTTSAGTTVFAAWLNIINKWAFWGRRPSYATTTGAANAQVLTLETGSLYVAGSEASGDEFVFTAGFTNNAAMTLQVLAPSGGNVARTVQLMAAALSGGEVVAGRTYKVTRLGTTWQLTNFTANTFVQSLFGATTKAALIALFTPLTTKGDLWGFDTADNRFPVGGAGSVLMARTASALGLAYVAALNKAIYGFTYANNGGDSIDIAAGGAMDSTGAYWITGAALTKNITTNWAVGNAQGMLDTGNVGNSDYYLYAIARSDTGVVDYIASLAAPTVGPAMPTSYTNFRAIGWFKRVGGTNVAFHTYETEGGGLELLWDSPTLDVNLTNTLTTARRTDAVKVPLNFSVEAHLNVDAEDGTSGWAAWICCPDHTDVAPATSSAPLSNISQFTATAAGLCTQVKVRTSAAGLIAARAQIATVDSYRVATVGFRWARRN